MLQQQKGEKYDNIKKMAAVVLGVGMISAMIPTVVMEESVLWTTKEM